MKNLIAGFVVFAVASLANYAFSQTGFLYAGQTEGFRVSAEAELEYYPDTLWLVGGISTEGLSVEEAMKENARIFSEVEKVLKDKLFKKYTIKIFPVNIGRAGRPYEIRRKQATGFKVDRWLFIKKSKVTKKNIDRVLNNVTAVMDTLTKAGVNMWGFEGNFSDTGKALWYGIPDYKNYADEVKRQAYSKLEDVKNKEIFNARVKTGELISICSSESFTNKTNWMNAKKSILPDCPLSNIFKKLKITGVVHAVYKLNNSE